MARERFVRLNYFTIQSNFTFAENDSMFKRWFSSVVIAGWCMLVDGLALIGVTRAFAPNKPPMWATAPFFWSVARPVQLFTWLLPPRTLTARTNLTVQTFSIPGFPHRTFHDVGVSRGASGFVTYCTVR